jgi:hypothetical protein
MIIVLSMKSSCILFSCLSLITLITARTFIRTATCRSCSIESTLNNSRSTSASVSNIQYNCSLRAVSFTRAAFHTIISTSNSHFLFNDLEHLMRTYLHAHPAVVAFFLNQFKRHNFRKISESFHMATFFRLRFQERAELQLVQRI